MNESEIDLATYDQLTQRNLDLVEELKALSLRRDIPWAQLSVDLTMKADERRRVMARMASITKRGAR